MAKNWITDPGFITALVSLIITIIGLGLIYKKIIDIQDYYEKLEARFDSHEEYLIKLIDLNIEETLPMITETSQINDTRIQSLNMSMLRLQEYLIKQQSVLNDKLELGLTDNLNQLLSNNTMGMQNPMAINHNQFPMPVNHVSQPRAHHRPKIDVERIRRASRGQSKVGRW